MTTGATNENITSAEAAERSALISVDSVSLNGTELDVAEVVRGGRIHLPDLAKDNTVTIVAH